MLEYNLYSETSDTQIEIQLVVEVVSEMNHYCETVNSLKGTYIRTYGENAASFFKMIGKAIVAGLKAIVALGKKLIGFFMGTGQASGGGGGGFVGTTTSDQRKILTSYVDKVVIDEVREAVANLPYEQRQILKDKNLLGRLMTSIQKHTKKGDIYSMDAEAILKEVSFDKNKEVQRAIEGLVDLPNLDRIKTGMDNDLYKKFFSEFKRSSHIPKVHYFNANRDAVKDGTDFTFVAFAEAMGFSSDIEQMLSTMGDSMDARFKNGATANLTIESLHKRLREAHSNYQEYEANLKYLFKGDASKLSLDDKKISAGQVPTVKPSVGSAANLAGYKDNFDIEVKPITEVLSADSKLSEKFFRDGVYKSLLSSGNKLSDTFYAHTKIMVMGFEHTNVKDGHINPTMKTQINNDEFIKRAKENIAINQKLIKIFENPQKLQLSLESLAKFENSNYNNYEAGAGVKKEMQGGGNQRTASTVVDASQSLMNLVSNMIKFNISMSVAMLDSAKLAQAAVVEYGDLEIFRLAFTAQAPLIILDNALNIVPMPARGQ